MTRVELTLALAAALAAALALGWALHALWRRLGGARDAETAALAERLAAAEADATGARAAAAEVEAALSDRLDRTETALRRKLAEREAELAAVMDTVGDLRRKLAEAQGAARAARERTRDPD